MQNTFEQINEYLESLELIFKNNAVPQIEKDIVLERLRKLYVAIYNGKSEVPEQVGSDISPKFEVRQGLEEDVDLFFDTDDESYGHHQSLPNQEEDLQKEIEKEEEQKRIAEEQRRKAEEEQRRIAEEQRRKAEEEQKRIAEEQRRKAEEEQKRIAEEQRRKAEEEQRRIAEEQRRKAEEEQRRIAEEQRRKAEEVQRRIAEEQRRKAEEEQRRIAEEQRRKAEEEQRRIAEEKRKQEEAAHSKNQPSDEDDLLQFIPKNNAQSTNKLGSQTPQRSLNDLFTDKREDRSLSAQFQHAKVTDLTKAISINDKFTYIKELFNNKGEEFSAAITRLNQCQDLEEAFDVLENLKQTFYWDSTSTAYLSLCDLLRRKFV